MLTINEQFATTLCRYMYLPEKNWFTATNFRDKALSSSVFFYLLLKLCGKYWSAARNIRNNEALVNLANKRWFTVIYFNVQLLR